MSDTDELLDTEPLIKVIDEVLDTELRDIGPLLWVLLKPNHVV